MSPIRTLVDLKDLLSVPPKTGHVSNHLKERIEKPIAVGIYGHKTPLGHKSLIALIHTVPHT
ncbi:hypothetical protein N7513_010524 [Penicillium frequentans]|nr:hypothetical protein N7513_010524 [Penicillium glabrum]